MGIIIDKNAKVCVFDDDCVQAKYAAQKIASVLSEVFSAEIPLVNTREDGCILIGKAADCGLSGVRENGYRITAKDGKIGINGSGSRGVVVGGYAFLEKFAKRRVYTKSLTVLPKCDKIEIPEDTDIEYSPYFEYTETDWLSPTDAEYSLSNGLTGGVYRRLAPEAGGTVDYLNGFAHSFTNGLCSAEKYFDEHPEYFALRDGKREPTQLCLTNENVYNIVRDEVMQILKEKHNPAASLQIISLTQADNQSYCTCEKCTALAKENGSQSGPLLTFVNRIAREVAAAGYDNVAVDTFAYQYTRHAPELVKPEPNVIIRLCTIEGCFVHPFDDEICPENAAIMRDLTRWGELCRRIYIWDYTTNYRYTIGLFPDFDVIARDMRLFYENGVKGIYSEGAYYVNKCNTEFGELRAYLLSRLYVNPYCDIMSEMNDFCRAFYGPGGENISEFLRRICKNAAKKHSGIYSSMRDTFSLTNEEAAELDGLWEKAKAAANGAELENILRSEISWRFVKSSLGLSEFSGEGLSENNEKLLEDIKKAGVTMYNEGGNFDKIREDFRTVGADKWA